MQTEASFIRVSLNKSSVANRFPRWRERSVMRVAAIYDIHGNLPALEAVLQELRREDVDHVGVGGDVVRGPMVREALPRLLEITALVQFIHANGEVAVLAAVAGRLHPAVGNQ